MLTLFEVLAWPGVIIAQVLGHLTSNWEAGSRHGYTIISVAASYIHSYIHFYFSLILDVDSSGLTDILYLCYVVDVLFISEPLNRLQGNLPQSLFFAKFSAYLNPVKHWRWCWDPCFHTEENWKAYTPLLQNLNNTQWCSRRQHHTTYIFKCRVYVNFWTGFPV